MALPKQVQEQADQADALQLELYGDKQTTESSVTTASVVTPDAQQQADPAPTPAPAPATEPASKPDAPEDTTDWKQKYKTIQGMYDAEVPHLQGKVKNLTDTVSELTEKVSELTSKLRERDTTAAVESRRNLVTDDDRREFGDEMIDFARKVAREETAELVAQLEASSAEIAELKQRLSETGEQVVTASFEHRLAQLVPDFAQVNVDRKWIEWLNEVDPMLRGPRMTAAQAAYAQGDAEGVAHFVRLFKESQQPAESPIHAPSTELESQIQPATAAAEAPSASPKGQQYTDADIRRMFKRVMELNVAGNTEAAKKLEMEIDSAYREGRVRS